MHYTETVRNIEQDYLATFRNHCEQVSKDSEYCWSWVLSPDAPLFLAHRIAAASILATVILLPRDRQDSNLNQLVPTNYVGGNAAGPELDLRL